MTSPRYLSSHFTLEELTRSDYAVRKGIDNTPDANVLSNLLLLASCLEGVRAVLSVSVHISSGYRSPKTNAGVGGSPTSAHTRGLAADFTAPVFGKPRDICLELVPRLESLGIDQLILEYPNAPNGGWVHISVDEHPRYMTLTKWSGDSGYERGIV